MEPSNLALVSRVEHQLDVPTVAYIAGIIDTQGVIRTRTAGDTELPYVALSGPNERMLRYLASMTGTKVTITRREFVRAGCAQHCAEKHQHITSISGRWSVSGVKATVLLYNIRPYLRLQLDEAVEALVVGLTTRYKPATVQKMADLGWEIPEFSTDNRVTAGERDEDGRFKRR